MVMSDDVFAHLVAEEVKNRVTDAQRAVIRLPENRERWKKALNGLLASLERQLAELAEREAREAERLQQLGASGTKLLEMTVADIEERRKKINRFKFFVEQKIAEVALMPDDEGAPPEEVSIYRRAIEQHKQLMEHHGFNPTPIDTALWETLNGKWLFDSLPDTFPDD